MPNAWGTRLMNIWSEDSKHWGILFLHFPPERSFYPSPPTFRGLDCPQDASSTANCAPIDRRREPSGRVVVVNRDTGAAFMAEMDGRLCVFERLGRDAGAVLEQMRATVCPIQER